MSKKKSENTPESIALPYLTLKGGIVISVNAGGDTQSIPDDAGLPYESYSHVDVQITQNGKPAAPDKIGLPFYAAYFNDAGTASAMARQDADALMADARKLHGIIEPEPVAETTNDEPTGGDA